MSRSEDVDLTKAARTMGQAQIYNSVTWRRVRLLVLARDGHMCQIRGAGCAITASQVDHIIAPRDGGGWYALENLRGACRSCNGARGGRVGARITNAKRWGTAAVKPSREW